MSDQIRAQVESMVSCASISYSARYVTQTKRDDWNCDAWRVSFAYPGKPAQEFEFYTGLGLRAPHVADALHSLILDSSACESSFSEWCAEYGYSDDSIKARETYDACRANTDKLRQVFTRAQIDALAEALREY